MDPNAALHFARSLVTEIIDAKSEDKPFGDFTDHAENLAEQFLALDEWLTKGGFLPGEWEHARAEVDTPID